MLDPAHAAAIGLTDRHGGKTAPRNDGTSNAQVTPMYLLVDALDAMDAAFVTYAAKNPEDTGRQASWRSARSQLVDTFPHGEWTRHGGAVRRSADAQGDARAGGLAPRAAPRALSADGSERERDERGDVRRLRLGADRAHAEPHHRHRGPALRGRDGPRRSDARGRDRAAAARDADGVPGERRLAEPGASGDAGVDQRSPPRCCRTTPTWCRSSMCWRRRRPRR